MITIYEDMEMERKKLRLANALIDMYMKEDYDYVVRTVIDTRKLPEEYYDTTEKLIEFIIENQNHILRNYGVNVNEFDDNSLNEIADVVLRQIKEIRADIWDKYGVKYVGENRKRVTEDTTENPNEDVNKLLDDFADYLEDEENIYVTDVDYSTKVVYVDTIEDLKKSRCILRNEYPELKQLGAHVLSTIGADGLNKDYIRNTKTQTESLLIEDEDRYIYIKSKEVYDDGWRTEYTMYQDSLDPERYVFVFGDSDLYDPNDGYEEFDWECEGRDEAEDWFYNYEGYDSEE